jgi:hypothetical protein
MKPKLQIALGVALAVGLASLGAACSSTTSGGAALELAPADSIAYFGISIEEGSDQEQALEDLLAKFEKAPSIEEAKQNIGDAIFEAAQLDITYADDVEEWLGDDAAFFVQAFDQDEVTAAAMIETTDQGATQDLMEEIDDDIYDQGPEARTYKDNEYDFYPEAEVASGFVEDFWIVGSEAGFKSVVDTSEGAGSLTGSDNFDEAVAELPAERLGLAYVDMERLVGALESFGGATSLQLFGNFDVAEAGAAAGALYVQPNAAIMEFASRLPKNQPAPSFDAAAGSGLIGDVPGDSWAALGLEELGRSVSTTLETFAGLPGGETFSVLERQLKAETGLDLQEDILGWMGDGGAFVEGSNIFELQGGVVIESRDAVKSAAALQKLELFIRSQGASVTPTVIEGFRGFAIQEPGMPHPVNFVAGDKVVIAYGDNATSKAIRASDPLRDSSEYQEAVDLLGEDFAPGFYVNFDTVLALAEAVGASSSPDYDENVKPWLDPLTHVIFGSKLEGNTVIQRFVIGVE